MKKYKTWEAIKMLTENKKLEFKSCDDDMYLKATGYDYISIKDKEHAQLNININDEWELIEQPVTWDEVLKSDKDCKVCHELLSKVNFFNDEEFDIQEFDRFDVVMYFLSKELNTLELKRVMEEGKWYLEN